ncbi:unnamed protein product [Allacma fusca]|uniref:SEC14-like protein 2 n=1 Tax=Allacma fusca TaxID=39272 RepID=A0A8J2NWJ6_9HEXA|nr:unnamed protein product [Allacma fusca]
MFTHNDVHNYSKSKWANSIKKLRICSAKKKQTKNMARPDAKEIELISQFRANVSDLNLDDKFNTDHFLLRWIRARQHNLDLAEKMLREHMKWREDNDIENIHSWTPPELFLKAMPAKFLGYDDDNSPVYLLLIGKLDLNHIIEIGEGNNYLKYLDYIFETVFNKMDGKFTRDGYPVTQFIPIVDQRGASYRSLCTVGAMDLNMKVTRRFEVNYPETMKTIFEINCNAAFSPFLPFLFIGVKMVVAAKAKFSSWKKVTMASPDAQELELISQFRVKVSDLNLGEKFNTDHYLLRWIRARHQNLDLADKMLREHMKWRQENQIDNILSWAPPERVVAECPMRFLGYDIDNSPVQFFPFGKWDMKKIIDMGEGDNYFKYMCQIAESLMSKMDGKVTRSGYPVTQFVIIVDQKGLSYRQLASVRVMDLNLTLTRRYEANYPESVKTVFEINCNAVFTALFAICKPLLSQETVDKLQIFSSDESKWRPAILASVPASILPTYLGGTNQNSTDNECIPKLTQIQIESEKDDESEFVQVVVPAGDKIDISFGVEEGHSLIEWAFRTEIYDISFSIYCNGKAYIQKNRVSSHLELQEGAITCEIPGDYTFTFDNVYSRWRAKTLWYKIDILAPSGRKHISV